MDKPQAPHAPGMERLQVVLARFGIASRRGVVTLIEEGKVQVNDQVVKEKGFRVDAKKDKIVVNGEELSREIIRENRYFIFNKPKGVTTTMQDPHAEKTVVDFFKDISTRLFPVGRLDRDTTGLLLMTNDGDLSFRLTHPKFGVKKRYHARVKGIVTEDEVKYLEKGVMLEEGKTAPCKITIENTNPKDTTLFVILHEGKKRQIRRIFDGIGHYVLDLQRLDYGPISLGTLKYGDKRELRPEEVRRLREATEVTPAPRAKSSKKK